MQIAPRERNVRSVPRGRNAPNVQSGPSADPTAVAAMMPARCAVAAGQMTRLATSARVVAPTMQRAITAVVAVPTTNRVTSARVAALTTQRVMSGVGAVRTTNPVIPGADAVPTMLQAMTVVAGEAVAAGAEPTTVRATTKPCRSQGCSGRVSNPAGVSPSGRY